MTSLAEQRMAMPPSEPGGVLALMTADPTHPMGALRRPASAEHDPPSVERRSLLARSKQAQAVDSAGLTPVLLPSPRRRLSGQGHRAVELKWREKHSEELRRYEGRWVVLEGETIVASDSDPAEAVEQARAQGIATPYVFFVDSRRDVARLGL